MLYLLKLHDLPPLISLTRRHEMFGSDMFSLGSTFFEERILSGRIRGAVVTTPLWTRRGTVTLAFEIMVPRWFMIRVGIAARHVQWRMSGSTTKVSMVRPSISIISGNFHFFQLVEGHVVHTIYGTGLLSAKNGICSFEELTWWVIYYWKIKQRKDPAVAYLPLPHFQRHSFDYMSLPSRFPQSSWKSLGL